MTARKKRASKNLRVFIRLHAFRRGFTLLEILLVIAIIAALTGIVLGAVRVQKVFTDSLDAEHEHYRKQIENAMYQHLVEEWELLSEVNIPEEEANAKPICRYEVMTDPTCVNLDGLIPTYMAALPVDRRETNPNYSGYSVYKQVGRVKVVATHLGEDAGGEEEGSLAKLYWINSARTQIHRTNLDGSNDETIVTTSNLSGIAFDTSNNKLYWSDTATGIHRANYDGTGAEVTCATSTATIEEVNPVENKVYFTKQAAQIQPLYRCNYDGTGEQSLSISGNQFVFDFVAGKVYWYQVGGEAPTKIARASLDGTGIEQLWSGSAFTSSIAGIALDIQNQKVYYFGNDPNPYKIWRMDLNGGNKADVVSGLSPAISLHAAPALGKLYWTESTDHSINRSNLDGTSYENNIVTGLNNPKNPYYETSDGKIVWLDGNTTTLMRANPDGTSPQTLVTGMTSYGLWPGFSPLIDDTP